MYPGAPVDYVDFSGSISGSLSADGNKLINCTFWEIHTSYSLYKTKAYYKEGEQYQMFRYLWMDTKKLNSG